MKKLSKILSLVLALAMVVMSINVVNANSKFKVDLVISSTADGHTFTAYQILKGTGTGDVSDVGTDAPLGDMKVPVAVDHILANVAFGDKITAASLDSAFRDYKSANPSTDFAAYTFKSFTSSNGLTAANLAKEMAEFSDNGRITEAFARAFKYYFEKDSTGMKVDKHTSGAYAEGTGYTISDLEEGYYLVTDSIAPGSKDALPAAAMLVLVGGTSATEKNTITVNPKNTQTSIEKELGQLSADADSAKYAYSVGDYVPFKVEVKIPDDVGLYKKYTIKVVDTLTNMTFNSTALAEKDSPDLTKGGIKIYEKDTPGELLNDHFKITVASVSSGTNNQMTIVHDDETYSETKHWDGHAGDTFVFEYSARLTDDAIGTNANNDAVLTYNNDPTTAESTDTDEATAKVFNHNLVINKKESDGASGYKNLKGAKFTIQTWNGSGWVDLSKETDYTVEVPTITADTVKFVWKGLGDGFYRITENEPQGYNKWGSTGSKIIQIKTTLKDKGTAIDNVDVTTYNDLDDPSSFNGKATSLKPDTDDVSFTWQSDSVDGNNGYAIKADVLNNKGATLPETGGMGTKIFYTLGGLLVACAVVLLVVKRRMRAE